MENVPAVSAAGLPRCVEGMRVGHLIQYLAIGGIERMVELLVHGLRERHGVASSVLAYLGDGPMGARIRAAGGDVAFVPSGVGFRPVFALDVRRWLVSSRIDVVHSHHVGPFLYGSTAARLAGTPHLHTEHSVELYDVGRRRAIGRVMPRVARVVAVSPAVADVRTRLFGDVCEVVPNGIPIPSLPTDADVAVARGLVGVGPGAFVVGCVARLSPEKDHDTLIRAFDGLLRLAPSVDAHLVLVGDGGERGGIEDRVATLNLGHRVHLLGSRDDLDRLWSGFDVVCLSSTREGLPLALIEGMASARPVVASAVGGIPALLSHGGGRCVPSQSPGELARALADYALDPQSRAHDGLRARQTVEARYGADRMVDRYVDLYRELLEQHRRTTAATGWRGRLARLRIRSRTA